MFDLTSFGGKSITFQRKNKAILEMTLQNWDTHSYFYLVKLTGGPGIPGNPGCPL